MTKWDNYDDSVVVLRDGSVTVDGVKYASSDTFQRDPRLRDPTAAMLAQAYWRDVTAPRIAPTPLGWKYCGSALKHAAPLDATREEKELYTRAVLPRDKFGTRRTNPDGKDYLCTDCRNELDRRTYERSRAVVRVYRRREWE